MPALHDVIYDFPVTTSTPGDVHCSAVTNTLCLLQCSGQKSPISLAVISRQTSEQHLNNKRRGTLKKTSVLGDERHFSDKKVAQADCEVV